MLTRVYLDVQSTSVLITKPLTTITVLGRALEIKMFAWPFPPVNFSFNDELGVYPRSFLREFVPLKLNARGPLNIIVESSHTLFHYSFTRVEDARKLEMI